MAKLSIGRAWEDSLGFISRDRRLIIPVMLSFVLLPSLFMRTLVPEVSNLSAILAGRVPPWATLLSYVLLFAQFVGAATVILLALNRKGSLGELILAGAKRTVVLFLAFILLGLMAAPAGILLVLLSAPEAVTAGAVPPGMARAASIFALVVLLLFLRLFLLIPAIVAERVGPWTGIRRGWELGRGSGWKLIGTFLLLMIASVVTNYAVGVTVGSLAQVLLGSAKGATVGGILVSLAVGLTTVCFQLIQNSMLAMLYRQATTQS